MEIIAKQLSSPFLAYIYLLKFKAIPKSLTLVPISMSCNATLHTPGELFASCLNLLQVLTAIMFV